MSEIKRLHAGARYSEASIHAGTVYLAGQVAVGGAGTIEAQTAEVLASIDRLLAEAGSSKSRILMVQIYLADMADYAGLNSVWDKWVAPSAPSRATVEAKLAKPEWKVEIVVTAAV
ncbi:MAG TPA: RidA family protein [Steroidobacteraceae bacterium]|nr:RidA family protein [Steroidobacteraceae bacterium]